MKKKVRVAGGAHPSPLAREGDEHSAFQVPGEVPLHVPGQAASHLTCLRQRRGEVDPRLVRVFDVFAGKVFVAPKAQQRRLGMFAWRTRTGSTASRRPGCWRGGVSRTT
ncbi:hypothetical protein D7X55_26870 [Corallococcus sp. AB049A]|nr:hypothetical protein D7X55_26870 [Corallococcus sp. AB049A]